MLKSDLPTLVLPRNPRYFSLDIWRGVACLSVVIYHSSFYAESFDNFTQILFKNFITHLRLGVTVFFVISGYCIAAASDSTRRKPRSVSRYFVRRFRRIFPPYWVLAGISVLIVGITALLGFPEMFADYSNHPIEIPWNLSSPQWFGNIFLVEEWRFHVFGDEQLYFLGHAWSLCYEEQFYAVCGLVLFFLPRRFFQGMAFVTFIVLIFAAFKNYLPISGFFFDGSWIVFAIGVLVYYRLNYAEGLHARLIDFILLIAPFIALAVLLRRLDRLSADLLVGSIFALIIRFLHPYDNSLTNAGFLKPIKFCGVMCYSLYLVHWVVVKFISKSFYLMGIQDAYSTLFVTIPVCIIASVILSWYFHLYIERRFLNPPMTIDNKEKIVEENILTKQEINAL